MRFDIADGYYMYRERFKFALEPGSSAKLGAPEFPPGIRKKDEFFGETETYRKQVVIRLPVEDAGGSLQLLVTSQGCADVGVCYIPMDSKATIRLAAAGGAAPGTAPALPAFTLQQSDLEVASLFERGGPLLVLASFLGFGLLLAFTPCVLPMVPILSGIIVGEGRSLGKARFNPTFAGFAIGLFGGGAIGFAVGDANRNSGQPNGSQRSVGLALGGALGAGLGALIGAALAPEHWRDIKLR